MAKASNTKRLVPVIGAVLVLFFVFSGTSLPWQQNYKLNICYGIGGSTNPAGGTYIKNFSETVTVQATPTFGLEFDYWMLNDQKKTENPITFTMTQDYTLDPRFKSPGGPSRPTSDPRVFTRSCPSSLFWSGFITPNDLAVATTLNEIKLSRTWWDIRPDSALIASWVSSHITPKEDQEIHGVPDYWQFPNETLSLKSGDCEDLAILFCSLCRADGYNEKSVFVVTSSVNIFTLFGAHAFNVVNDGLWGWHYIDLIFGSLSPYIPQYVFNDKIIGYYFDYVPVTLTSLDLS